MHSLTAFLCRAACNFSDKVAISDKDMAFSYIQLKNSAEALSFDIKKTLFESSAENSTDLNESVSVGVIASHDVYSVLALWATLFAGCAYVPIDPKIPQTKLTKIINDANIKLVAGRKSDKDITASFSSLPFIAADEADFEATNINESDSDCCDSVDSLNSADDSAFEKPAYIIYTSGSTGTPKGIIKSHGAVIDFINAYIDTFDFSSEEIIGCQTPFYFDASAKDIFLAAATGATLEIIPDGMFVLPPALIRYLNEKQITFISWVPSALSVVTQLNTFEEVKPEYLSKIFFVGESFPLKQFKRWLDALPDADFANLYGASEIAGICCYYKVPKNFFENAGTSKGEEIEHKPAFETENPTEHSADRLPIGKPLKNCKVLLLDNENPIKDKNNVELSNDDLNIITDPFITGEIYLASKALFSGYLNMPEETENLFIKISGEMFFKTGDLAFYDEEGNLNFASRADNQIKHMGMRIELGEIETISSSLDEISKACCIYNPTKKKIILFCEPEENAEASPKDLLIKLKSLIPSYMLPQKVIIKDKLPINRNGKIDRQLLTKTEV